MNIAVLCFALMGLCAAPAVAQVPPIVNPNAIEFSPSPDQDVIVSGVPVVTRYTVDLALADTPTVVVKNIDIGKPPIVNGKVTYPTFATVRDTLANGSYIVIIQTEGPGGAKASVASDPFIVIRLPGAAGKPAWK